nr:hypothetical protein Iba_chr01bCG1700 [Ipomoea batatas]GMC50974.1 hypothetical protein Iba_chr01cCG1900 [Ipomoea batatas]GMC52823.1 hypothetical protein Iba_chr01dCG0940 [Ipomoea batatas]GMD39075.1 hypothetical protein Iba_chr09fCG10120 [Ipomoea batatas]
MDPSTKLFAPTNPRNQRSPSCHLPATSDSKSTLQRSSLKPFWNPPYKIPQLASLSFTPLQLLCLCVPWWKQAGSCFFPSSFLDD